MDNSPPMDTLVVPATVDALSPIGQFVLQAAAAAGLPRKRAYRLRLAVDEIATNVIHYGYGGSGQSGDLTLRAELTEDSLTLVLEDTSPPFDPRTHPVDPESLASQSVEERRVGGLGIFLTLQGVDSFDYRSSAGRNLSRFVVRREPAAEAEER
ncbi:MAG TPA: ATP-binding protein [Chthonomonadaceae bacterium]|nr:ATP-binding protein [Chthonomonadaceae bacterium]